MPLQKQGVDISFIEGLDTKSDPKRVKPGKFLELKNSVFTKAGLLQKRNGFPQLSSLPDSSSTYLTTLNGNLTAIGTKLDAYSPGSAMWTNKGTIEPVVLDTLSMIKNNTNQTQCDSVVASNGLACIVYTDVNGGTSTYKYAVLDTESGQNIVAPTTIPVTSGTVSGSPRVFLLANLFVIVFTNTVAGTPHLDYITVSSIQPTITTANASISTAYTPNSRVAFDGVVANNRLYLAWNGNDGGGAIRMSFLSSSLVQGTTVVFAGRVATMMSLCADNTGTTPNIYASFYNTATSTGYVLCVDASLNTILAPTQWIPTGTVLNVTSSAQNGAVTIIWERDNSYTYDGAIKTNYINYRTCTSGGSLGTVTFTSRSVGLASKSFILDGTVYFLTAYSSSNQPTYFLMNLSGKICLKLAYSNGGGYLALGLPSVSLTDTTAKFAYLIKDAIIPVNKSQGSTVSSAIYSQTGINLASVNFTTSNMNTAEIANDLHLTGGFLWMYDGYSPVENGFFVWPDNVEVSTAGAGGSITAQQYYYIAIYEWSDNQGNIHRSAPSIAAGINVAVPNTTNTVHVPTLRLTYKTQNPVKIVLYRWSTAQQVYYQVTSVTSPTLNNTSVDYVDIVDVLSDSAIAGNSILYTTGGVIENIAAPAVNALTLYRSRLFAIDAENPDQIWYSKQVIQGTPVEMSDLFTLYVAPTVGVQGNSGKTKCLFSMDDKLLVFKNNAIYYFTGNGPDNVGTNNDFSDPVYITSTIGCDNQNSIVLTPDGVMFQAGTEIWILTRDLQTNYIGAPVESLTTSRVKSAFIVPDTNQVRFTMADGTTLMYDYYYNQWGSFEGMPGIASTIFENLHTYIDATGKTFQEKPDTYLDGANPVLLSFKTGPMNLAGLQGYERAYYFYLLGEYKSPHRLNIGISFNYEPSPSQNVVITPTNANPYYGDTATYGDETPYGGSPTLERWRVFFQQQRCQAFQITLNEVFNSEIGQPAGAGFTLSGLNLVVGMKKGYFPIKSANSRG